MRVKNKYWWLVMAAGIVAVFSITAIRYGVHLDPTEQVFTVRLHNDSIQTVTVGLCENTPCSRISEIQKLQAGHDIPLAASDQGVLDEYRVNANGHPIGCVHLIFYNRDVTQLELMNSMRPCGH